MKKQLLHLTGAIVLALAITTSGFAQEDEIPPAPYSMNNMNVYAVFVSSAKTKDYENALRYGRWLYKYHTNTLEGVDQYDGPRTYRRMIDVYKGIGKDNEDPTIKSTYFDSVVVVFDKALNVFSDEEIDRFDWLVDRGLFFQRNASYLDNAYTEAYSNYTTAFEMDPERLTKLGKGYYVRITLSNLVGRDDKEAALEMIEKAEPYASEELLTFFDEQLNELFDKPEERIGFLQEKLEETPEDTGIMGELLDLYNEMEMYDEASEMAKRLYETDPNLENTLRLARTDLANARYKDAITYLTEALEMAQEDEVKKQIYIDLAEANLNIENLQTARKHARSASKIDSDWGEPYMKIAEIYAQLVSNCAADEMTRDDKAVYWLVVDYLNKAMQVDPSVTNRANARVKAYQASFPTSEEKFFKNWEDGDSININGSLKSCYSWVGETTTIR